MKPLLSVVVIGRNEGKRLQRCLQSVLVMKTPSVWIDFEYIYVDSGSSDNSLRIARDLGFKTVRLGSDHPTAARARNAGWRQANGQLVLFLDGDTILQPEFVAKAIDEFADQDLAVVFGHRRELDPSISLYSRVLDLDWVWRGGRSEYCGGDAIIRRTVLEQVGGYDNHLIAGEEPEMCQRIRERGYLIVNIGSLMTLHELAITSWRQYWRRAVRAGFAYAEVSHRTRRAVRPLWRNEVRRVRRHSALIVTAAAATLLSALTGPSWLTFVFVGLGLAAVLRTALRARWKSTNRLTLALYGIHSHVQQIPLLVGQLQYWLRERTHTRQSLIEYK